MIIPGFVISIVTFPGVIIHELAHQIFCMLCGMKIYEVKYFQPKNPCGYVIHEPSDRPLHVFLTAMGPFFINTILGMLILLPASIEILEFRDYTSYPLNLVLAWLGISILMHSFPSTGDAKVMVKQILKNPDVGIFWKVLAAPFVGLIYLFSIGSMFWLDLVYAMAVGMLLPNLLVHLF